MEQVQKHMYSIYGLELEQLPNVAKQSCLLV